MFFACDTDHFIRRLRFHLEYLYEKKKGGWKATTHSNISLYYMFVGHKEISGRARIKRESPKTIILHGCGRLSAILMDERPKL